MLNCICGAKQPPMRPSLRPPLRPSLRPPLRPSLPVDHDKAYLRERYPKRAVDLPAFVNGNRGRYTLGAGKHGKVKAAYSVQHGCNVAIKSQNKHQWLVAKGEAELARSLKLEHVIGVYDWAEGPKKSYIVMEEGAPLHTDGATPDSARALLWNIIAGLRELHAHDIYHRDIGVYEREEGATIKNIMVAGGVCKMTDIGKMACAPPAALRAVYARADARGLARVIQAFMRVCDPDEAEPFYRWYTSQPHLRVEDLAAHPWLHNQPRPAEPSRARAALYPMHVFAEWVTAPAPLLTGRGQPVLESPEAPPHPADQPACVSSNRL